MPRCYCLCGGASAGTTGVVLPLFCRVRMRLGATLTLVLRSPRVAKCNAPKRDDEEEEEEEDAEAEGERTAGQNTLDTRPRCGVIGA